MINKQLGFQIVGGECFFTNMRIDFSFYTATDILRKGNVKARPKLRSKIGLRLRLNETNRGR